MFSIIKNLRKKIHACTKVESGMTLIEVVLAFLIIAIVSTVLVRGTITAVDTMRINKSKTEALAIANEKIEIIKAIDYSEIIITAEDDELDPWISDYPELPEHEDEYTILYKVTWVDVVDVDVYKQLEVSVSGGYMIIPIDIVTQLYPPVGEEATIGNIYPPPDNLTLDSDGGEPREVIISWVAPDTDEIISGYNVYRGGAEPLNTSPLITMIFYDYPGDDNVYTYQVTAVYEDGTESVKSNSVSTGTPFIYPPPENLEITGYSGDIGIGWTVHLAWSAPVTELVILEYQIYRDGVLIDSTVDLIYENIIGTTDYTFYVKILYEDDNLSDQSTSVTAGTPLPPENLEITGYTLGGPNRTVHLAWSAPVTELVILEYQIYRDGVLIDSTVDLIYENKIGTTDYTFYVKTLYQGNSLSEQSDLVITN